MGDEDGDEDDDKKSARRKWWENAELGLLGSELPAAPEVDAKKSRDPILAQGKGAVTTAAIPGSSASEKNINNFSEPSSTDVEKAGVDAKNQPSDLSGNESPSDSNAFQPMSPVPSNNDNDDDNNSDNNDNNQPLIDIRSVFFRYPTRMNTTVLRSFNLQIKRGTIHAIVGPSGSGKTTGSFNRVCMDSRVIGVHELDAVVHREMIVSFVSQ